MLDFTNNKSSCTGCTACMAACPIGCISMVVDNEGFIYPKATDACINCGKCKRVCPVIHHDKTSNHSRQKAYACVTKNKEIWKRSASGGAFSEICLSWGDDKTIVVGAAWDGLKVHHVSIEGVRNIAKICKSKYVASNPENTFREILAYLKEGRKVIFCGTPCQVAGLKLFLQSNFDNLLTIDLICHGVGSPTVFEVCVHKIEKQYNMHDIHYEFRAKRKTYETDYLSSIKDTKSTIYIKDDPYMQLFLKQCNLRPSCGKNCVFRESCRQGDITLADFKGLTTIFPGLEETKRNYSAIITNSIKAESIIPKLKSNSIVLDATIDDIKRYNPLFYRQTHSAEDRDLFFREFIKSPVATIDKWTHDAVISKLSFRNKMITLMPSAFVRFLKRLLLKK